ncbi:MAG TPA: hypothetical protein VEW42_06195 [Candidatus Eisenbacteria bacterium]|nr:hypothetical protein [Candidatus Eisenbacteria bacterium]
MIGCILLLLIFLHGLVLSQVVFKNIPIQIKIISGFIFGSVLCVSSIYWITCLTKSLDISLILFSIISCVLIVKFFTSYRESIIEITKTDKKSTLFLLLLVLFSYFLFTKIFRYDSIHGNFLIASNVYVDFGAHIPFIRSFSLGNNFPGEVPFFANAHLPYYFLFDFYTGILEHMGMRIDIAYNILSALSFSCLLILIYYLGRLVFKSRKVGIVSTVLFLFSSNLSFVSFFQKYGFRLSTISSWWHTNFYYEGLYTPLNKTVEISGFWNLNPYMNQRHLTFGIAFFLLFCLIWLFFVKEKKVEAKTIVLLGLSLGLLPYWHAMIFLMVYMTGGMMLLLYKEKRKQLFYVLLLAACIALPQLVLIKFYSANTIVFKPGFLLDTMLNLQNIAIFWILNLGISIVTIPIGFLVASKNQRKFFFLFLPLFILPNLFHFSSRYPFDDHKYFLVWILTTNIFSSFFIVYLFSKSYGTKLLSIALIVLLTLSGIISIMVIKNDIKTSISDYQKNAFMQWASTHIPPTATIFTNGEIYDPATLVGRKTFLGRNQYIYNYGGNYNTRLINQDVLLQGKNMQDIMSIVHAHTIQYVIFYKNNFAKNERSFNNDFYNITFKKIYEDRNAVVFKI